MPDPKPIKQRIETEADTSGIKEHVRAQQEMEKETKESTQTTEKSTAATKESTRAQTESARATERAGDEAEDAGKKQGFLARHLNGVVSAAAGMVTGFFGLQAAIQLVTSYINGLNEAADKTIERLDQIAQKADEAAKATLDLHAISLGFNEADERLAADFSKASGRSFQESASVLTGFLSSTAALDREDQERLFREGLLAYALTTSGSIEPAAKFYGRVSSITQDPEEINNLLLRSVSLAGERDPGQFLEYAGQLLTAGNDAGITPAETLGLLAFGSGKTETALATTSLRSIMTSLTSDPAKREQLRKMGIDPSGGLFSTLDQFQSVGLTEDQSFALVGGEHSGLLNAMVREYETVQQFRQQNIDALSSGDLAGDFIRNLTEKSPEHARSLQLAQLQQELTDLQRQDAEKALAIEIARTQVEIELERAVLSGTLDASAKEARLKRFDTDVGGGITFDGRIAAGSHIRRQIAHGHIPLTDQQRRLVEGKNENERKRLLLGLSDQ